MSIVYENNAYDSTHRGINNDILRKMVYHNKTNVLLDERCYDYIKNFISTDILPLLSPSNTLIPLTENEYQFMIEDTHYIINRDFKKLRETEINKLI